MPDFIWTIALISFGLITPTIQYIGNFQEESSCLKTINEIKIQKLNPQLKAICVQIPKPLPPVPPPVVKPREPSNSVSSRDAKK
jgi:hypothetical protein